MLNVQVAQAIVNRMMSVLHVNINIMDINGRIIAAGNHERIGGYHSAAAEVIASGKKKTVSAVEAAQLDGVKPGITLPIIYKNTILGALGMTGEPEQVEKYGELVVLTALLIIEQEEMKEQVYQEQRARESLLVDLFTGRCLEDPALFHRRAGLLDVALDQNHLILVARLAAMEQGLDPLLVQRRRTLLADRLASFRIRGRSVENCFLSGGVALLSPGTREMPRARQAEDAQFIYTFLQEETDAPVLLAVGGLCQDWQSIPNAFARAAGVLETAVLCGRTDGALFFEDYLTEHTLRQIPAPAQADLCTSVLGGLTGSRPEQCAQMLDTLQRYYDNDMNAQKTADDLFLHRNTLNIRLNKIRDLTGYAPQRFRDAMVLQMALVLRGMGETNPTEMERICNEIH